jgi:hypothetical protein
MLLDSRLNINGSWAILALCAAETEPVCSQSHELAGSISLHQDRAEWETTAGTIDDLYFARIQAKKDRLAAGKP